MTEKPPYLKLWFRFTKPVDEGRRHEFAGPWFQIIDTVGEDLYVQSADGDEFRVIERKSLVGLPLFRNPTEEPQP